MQCKNITNAIKLHLLHSLFLVSMKNNPVEYKVLISVCTECNYMYLYWVIAHIMGNNIFLLGGFAINHNDCHNMFTMVHLYAAARVCSKSSARVWLYAVVWWKGCSTINTSIYVFGSSKT